MRQLGNPIHERANNRRVDQYANSRIGDTAKTDLTCFEMSDLPQSALSNTTRK